MTPADVARYVLAMPSAADDDDPPPACCDTQHHEGVGHDRDCQWARQQEPAHPELWQGGVR